ncbi:hypothetical protein CDD83_6203 [Cordyceps sp. RAO-2017]|nr:hypothetical protein CDD83_6203 [Cordyceps sp. RAO-2017]
MGSVVERGFKPVRGRLTEGRYLVMEMNDWALAVPSPCAPSKKASLSKKTEAHEAASQRWVAHAVKIGGNQFTLSSNVDKRYLGRDASLCSSREGALTFTVDFQPSRGYSFQDKDTSLYLVATEDGNLSFEADRSYWKVFSVNY